MPEQILDREGEGCFLDRTGENSFVDRSGDFLECGAVPPSAEGATSNEILLGQICT
jgi:hypothetical protein